MINQFCNFQTKPSVKITLHSGKSYIRTLVELTPNDVIIIGTDGYKYIISLAEIDAIHANRDDKWLRLA